MMASKRISLTKKEVEQCLRLDNAAKMLRECRRLQKLGWVKTKMTIKDNQLCAYCDNPAVYLNGFMYTCEEHHHFHAPESGGVTSENPAHGGFTDEELEILYHAAAYALGDVNMFDKIADYLDIADENLVMLREKLTKYLVS